MAEFNPIIHAVSPIAEKVSGSSVSDRRTVDRATTFR
jgi:hypothetical protein